jgi:1-aminocyclopropane-1-carboxylate deaminase
VGVDVRIPSPLIELADERLTRHGLTLLVKRDDLIHPDLPGNKWRKLRDNLAEAARREQGTLLTFGGAYSNHIRAVAAAGHHCGLRTIGVIRGEEHLPLNPSLGYAVAHGMHLAYLDRTAYRAKHTAPIIDGLRDRWGDFYLIPEGGSNEFAVRGCAELPAEIGVGFDVICTPVGTGGTLAGIAAGLAPHQRAVGFSVLRGGEFLDGQVEELQRQAYGSRRGRWTIAHSYHTGGYAKTTPELDQFIVDFRCRHDVPLDRIYTGKMMLGILGEAAAGAFAPGTRIVAVITGTGLSP